MQVSMDRTRRDLEGSLADRVVPYTKENHKHMARGIVKWFNPDKGFGFISPDDGGDDLFVHYTGIDSSGYRSLDEQQRVEFEVVRGKRGLQAEKVRVLTAR